MAKTKEKKTGKKRGPSIDTLMNRVIAVEDQIEKIRARLDAKEEERDKLQDILESLLTPKNVEAISQRLDARRSGLNRIGSLIETIHRPNGTE